MMNIERAKEFKSSLLWADTCEEIDRKVHLLTQRLHICKVDELREIQIEIQVLQALKNMPDDVISREENV